MKFFILTLVMTSIASLQASSNNVIVLIPGAASSGTKISLRGFSNILGTVSSKDTEYFKSMREYFNGLKIKTMYCILKTDNDSRSLTDRSKECSVNLQRMSKRYPHLRFHLLGHSMGGLIARQVYKNSNIQNKIRSVTTISTPHRGSLLSFYAIKNYKSSGPVGMFLRKTHFTPIKKYYLRDLTRYLNYTPSSNWDSIGYSIINYKTNWYNAPMETTYQILANQIQKYFPHRPTYNDGIVETYSMPFGKVIGTVKGDHMETGCILYTSYSDGCKKTLKILRKHYFNLFSN